MEFQDLSLDLFTFHIEGDYSISIKIEIYQLMKLFSFGLS